MSANFWFYEVVPSHPELSALGENKQSIRSAHIGLKTIVKFQAEFVYVAPWLLQRNDWDVAIDEWTDYYLQALALKEEYPTRVTLKPLDVFLTEKGVEHPSYEAQSVMAVVYKAMRSDVFDLFEKLEASASVKSRKPFLASMVPALDSQFAIQIDQAMAALARGSSNLVEPSNTNAVEFGQLQGELKKVQTENKLLIKQIHFLQEELERHYNEGSSLREEVALTQNLIKQAYAELGAKLKSPV